MAQNIHEKKTFCNPMSLPECPQGRDFNWKTYTGDSYRSISDPSVMYYDNKWYLYPSYGIAWVSEDFATWKHVECTPYDAPCYSPSVIPWKGKFLLTAHSHPLYVGDTPTGPFELLGSFIMPDGKEINPSDSALFLDDTGRIYIYWCSGRPDPERGVTVHRSVGVELDYDNPRRMLTMPVVLNEMDPSHPWERFGQRNQDEEFGWIEGQWMVKHNGRYYLIYAASGTEFGSYSMGAYYSDEGPLGPFTYQKNNPVTRHCHGLVSGAGHGCIEHGPNNTLWAFYTTTLAYTYCFERRIGMDYIDVNEDGELYCPRITDTPQYAPGQVADHLNDGDTGLLPLTFGMRDMQKSSSHIEGRNSFYALEENMQTWWQPRPEDKQPSMVVPLSAPYEIEASRIIWREVGLDYDNGVLPGPFKYKIEVCPDDNESEWHTLIDATDNDTDLYSDYRTFPAKTGRVVRLTITGWPEGIAPGVVSFTVFGKRAPLVRSIKE